MLIASGCKEIKFHQDVNVSQPSRKEFEFTQPGLLCELLLVLRLTRMPTLISVFFDDPLYIGCNRIQQLKLLRGCLGSNLLPHDKHRDIRIVL